MKLKDELRVASKLLLKCGPSKMGVKTRDGETTTLGELAEELKTVSDWVSTDLEQNTVTKVVRCKNCMYYKKYKYKGPKGQIFRACCLNKIKRDPMFFCSDGEER